MSQWSSHFFHGLFKNFCGYVIKTFARNGFHCCGLWLVFRCLFYYIYKKLLNSSAISLIFEFDIRFMINVSGMVGRLFCLCIA